MINPDEPIWTPSQAGIRNSQLCRFIQHINDKFKLDIKTYKDLHAWSVSQIDDFWSELVKFLDLESSFGHFDMQVVREKSDPTQGSMLGWNWFPNAKVNYARQVLSSFEGHEGPALICYSEGLAELEVWSPSALEGAVKTWAKYLFDCGVRPGDRVAGVCVNGAEAIIGFLASAYCGAVWASCSPDFGVDAIVDRLSQIDPKVLFWSDSYMYRGKRFCNFEKLKGLLSRVSNIGHLVVCKPSAERLQTAIKIEYWTNGPLDYEKDLGLVRDIPFVELGFNDPMLILFSSGTTGMPKCIVHSVGGTLVQHMKELSLHCGLAKGDRLFFYTTCGWMMWNWMVSGLCLGVTVVTFDGSPVYPTVQTLWQIVREQKVKVFGISPKYLSIVRQEVAAHGSSSIEFGSPNLSLVLATGSPLLEEHFDFLTELLPPQVQIASISGGTDIVSCFVLGNPISPVYRGEIQCAGLGMSVEIWDSEVPAKLGVGQKGELVCTKPFISMPIGFLGDNDGKKYCRAYFEHYNGVQVWRHGDFASQTQNDGFKIWGRSDATLNPGGVRIGSAEIYRVLEAFAEIKDSLVFGYQAGDDLKVVALLVMAEGHQLTAEFKGKLNSEIRSRLSPRHVPSEYWSVSDIPYTRSGKKMELAAKTIFEGGDVHNSSAAASPDVLFQLKTLAGKNLDQKN